MSGQIFVLIINTALEEKMVALNKKLIYMSTNYRENLFLYKLAQPDGFWLDSFVQPLLFYTS